MSRLDDYNYYNDSRVRAREAAEHAAFKVIGRDPGKRTATVQLCDEIIETLIENGAKPDDFDGIVECSVRFEVCPTCDGHGKHVDPNIDAGGISGEDFYDDEDFAEGYMGGRYDVTCYECNGERVVPQVDLPADIVSHVDEYENETADYLEVSRAERMMGA